MANVRALPERYRALHDPAPYPVRRSAGILELRERASRLRQGVGSPSTRSRTR